MKNALLALPLLALASVSHAAVIIDNTFNSVTTGAYNGTTGQEYGAAAELGNATASRTVNTVNASGGVDNSQYLSGQNPAIRSRSTVDITTIGTVSFSTYFKFVPTNTTTGGILGLGWALPAGADAANPTLTSTDEDRLLVGLRRVSGTTNEVTFSANGTIPGSNITGTPTGNTLTSGNWYQLSFDLTFNYNSTTPTDSNYTVEDLSLKNWGTDGLTGGGVVMSMASATIAPTTFSGNLDTTHAAYAFLVTNSSSLGGGIVDNVLVTAPVPEPSTMALLAGMAALGLVMYRRRR